MRSTIGGSHTQQQSSPTEYVDAVIIAEQWETKAGSQYMEEHCQHVHGEDHAVLTVVKLRSWLAEVGRSSSGLYGVSTLSPVSMQPSSPAPYPRAPSPISRSVSIPSAEDRTLHTHRSLLKTDTHLVSDLALENLGLDCPVSMPLDPLQLLLTVYWPHY